MSAIGSLESEGTDECRFLEAQDCGSSGGDVGKLGAVLQTAHVQVGGLKIFDKQLISVLNVAATVPGLVVTMLMVATQVMSPLQVATEEGGATLDHL